MVRMCLMFCIISGIADLSGRDLQMVPNYLNWFKVMLKEWRVSMVSVLAFQKNGNEYSELILWFLVVRFLGSTKVSLKDLAAGQSTSLPSKNVPLADESGQSIGVGSVSLRSLPMTVMTTRKNAKWAAGYYTRIQWWGCSIPSWKALGSIPNVLYL